MPEDATVPLATLFAAAVKDNLIAQAEKVRDGWIRDPDLVRPILKQITELEERLAHLMYNATDAFVEGWEATQTITPSPEFQQVISDMVNVTAMGGR